MNLVTYKLMLSLVVNGLRDDVYLSKLIATKTQLSEVCPAFVFVKSVWGMGCILRGYSCKTFRCYSVNPKFNR